jgi:hypothetical protein
MVENFIPNEEISHFFGCEVMGGGRIFLKTFRASLFNEGISNEPNFGQIHLAGQYL